MLCRTGEAQSTGTVEDTEMEGSKRDTLGSEGKWKDILVRVVVHTIVIEMREEFIEPKQWKK